MSNLLESDVVEAVLEAGVAAGSEFVEIFVEDVARRSVSLDDRRIENLASSRDRGVGIRAVVGDRVGFAHTSDLSLESLLEAVNTAAAAAVKGLDSEPGISADPQPVPPLSPPVQIDPAEVAAADKVALVRAADEAARAEDEAITQVSARYAETRRRIQVANTDGVLNTDARPGQVLRSFS